MCPPSLPRHIHAHAAFFATPLQYDEEAPRELEGEDGSSNACSDGEMERAAAARLAEEADPAFRAMHK